jgi:peptidoglycan/xylan/chitin deacetylase (PgdA/CDA1 family)
MSHTVTVLMYHAVGDEKGVCPGADQHYAVASTQFANHLALCRAQGRQVRSVADLLRAPGEASRSVAFTFDDGHASNGPAAELIASQGGSADFFVNPAHVGTPHYLSWTALREMADAGMSIQSHGFHHRYLDDLSPKEVEFQVIESKLEIENKLGRPVTIFAPPGGRIAPNLRDVATRAGYAAVCSSRVGLWHMGDGSWDVARLAVMLSTSPSQFARWVAQDWLEINNRRARYWALSSAKRVLGNHRYDALRKRFLGAAESKA